MLLVPLLLPGPRPKIAGELAVLNAGACTLAGLELQNLRLEGLTGRPLHARPALQGARVGSSLA